jgi:hypothetical protein
MGIPSTMTRERIDLAPARAKAEPARQSGIPGSWPTCPKAPRTTEPRLK